MKRKILAILLAMGLLTTGLAGCGSSKENDATANSGAESTTEASKESGTSTEKTTVVFWDENAGPTRTPYYEELIKRFEESNPDIEIEYVGLPNSDAKNKIEVAVAGNAAPDIAGMPPQWQASFILNGASRIRRLFHIMG